MEEKVYDICGVKVQVSSEIPEVIREFDRDLAHFARAEGKPDFKIAVKHESGLKSLPDESILTGKDWFGENATHEGRLYNIYHSKRQLIEVRGERGEVNCLVDEFTYDLFFRLRSYMKQAVVALLEEKGIYHIHGAALARKGRGVILNGGSNAGKTRAVLSLAGRGFSLVTDDLVLFRDGVLVPFHLRCDVDVGHLNAFPKIIELLKSSSSIFGENPVFWSVHLDGLFEKEGGAVSPAAIVFVNRWNSRKTKSEEITPERALSRLMESYPEFCQNVFFLSRKNSRLEVAGFYSSLLDDVRAYNFYVGSDTRLFAEEFEKITCFGSRPRGRQSC
jgi:hypothetical protein